VNFADKIVFDLNHVVFQLGEGFSSRCWVLPASDVEFRRQQPVIALLLASPIILWSYAAVYHYCYEGASLAAVNARRTSRNVANQVVATSAVIFKSKIFVTFAGCFLKLETISKLI
jgi:hypothetical protein